MKDEPLQIVETLIAKHRDLSGPLLPLLHEVQEAFGYIPVESVASIARGLNLSRAEVHGVVSYYHHFRTTPPARNVIRLCRAEACQARGGEALAAHAQRAVEGRDLTLEPVYCLGLCSCGPAMQIDETQLHARLTVDKFDRLIAELEAGS